MTSALMEMISFMDLNKIFFSKILELVPYQQILKSWLALLCLQVAQRILTQLWGKNCASHLLEFIIGGYELYLQLFSVFRCFDCFSDVCFDEQFFNLTIYLICLLVGFFYFIKFNFNFSLILKWVSFLESAKSRAWCACLLSCSNCLPFLFALFTLHLKS